MRVLQIIRLGEVIKFQIRRLFTCSSPPNRLLGILRNKRSLSFTFVLNRRCISSLVQTQGYINGFWVDSSDCKVFEVKNPANGKCLSCVADMTVDDAKKAIESAHKAFYSPEWAGLTALERSRLLRAWYNLLLVNKDEMTKIMTAESGKSMLGSINEVNYGNSYIEWFSEEARRIYGEIIPAPSTDRQILVMKEPIGVAAMITPWNFPLAMMARKAGAALAAGCTVVIKPSEYTPLTALAAIKLAEQAGFPKGVINVVTTMKGKEIADLFCSCPIVRGISFTGSVTVGKQIYKKCADNVKRLVLELGGNAPFIIFDSSNMERAVSGAMVAKFRNCGQACVSPNRFFVQKGVYDQFVESIQERIVNLKMGPGDQEGVQLGPLINKKQFDKISMLVEDAKCNKAKVIAGGEPRCDIGELFYAPTIITDVRPDMKVYTEEIFGPIISILKFDSEEEVIKMANDIDRGLGGYIFSEDIQQIFRVARKLQVGLIGVNEGLISTAEAPFGGVKESGIGREGSHYGIDDYIDIKYICLGNMKY